MAALDVMAFTNDIDLGGSSGITPGLEMTVPQTALSSTEKPPPSQSFTPEATDQQEAFKTDDPLRELVTHLISFIHI